MQGFVVVGAESQAFRDLTAASSLMISCLQHGEILEDVVALEWLPPYAPELNPVEQVWGHTKYAWGEKGIGSDWHCRMLCVDLRRFARKEFCAGLGSRSGKSRRVHCADRIPQIVSMVTF